MSSGRRSTGLATALRWVAFPCAAIALATWSVATLASLHSAASLAYSESFVAGNAQFQTQVASKSPAASVAKPALPSAEQAARTLSPTADPFAAAVAQAGISREKLHALFADAGMAIVEPPSVSAVAQAPEDPFAGMIAEAQLSRDKMLAAFAAAGVAVVDIDIVEPVQLASAMPAAARFHRPEEQADADPFSSLVLSNASLGDLAYAEVEAGADDPVQLALASLSNDPFGLPEDEYDSASLPDSIDLPDAKPDAPRAKPATAEPAVAAKPAKNVKPQSPAKPDTQALAYARPDKPAAGAFGKLFKSPGPGAKIAVYDISAAVVHMPDGTKLEAHSGIGKMADNPRYVHVKMKGPTPPNTYKLSMREKRFHGVEAIRMTPIGSQTMHGRDGMLAHSYLLRGGREESHGCVAFANYPKFLKAFKQGKVTHMIVVPSMSQLPKQPKVQMVSNIR